MGIRPFRQGPDHDTPGLLMSARETRSQARRRVFRRRRQVAATGLLLSCALLVLGGFRLAAAFTEPSGGQAGVPFGRWIDTGNAAVADGLGGQEPDPGERRVHLGRRWHGSPRFGKADHLPRRGGNRDWAECACLRRGRGRHVGRRVGLDQSGTLVGAAGRRERMPTLSSGLPRRPRSARCARPPAWRTLRTPRVGRGSSS